MRTWTLIALALLAAAPALKTAPKPQPGDDDPVIRALADELDRAKALRTDTLDRPYYLAASESEQETFIVSARFGALFMRGRDKSAGVRAGVRVGDAALDDTNFFDREAPSSLSMDRLSPPPAEGDYDALRRALWLRFDEAYKAAVETIARKRAYLETKQVKERPPDFSAAPTVDLVLPREKLQIDEEKWAGIVKRASALFRATPSLQVGDATLIASVETQCLVTSDPARQRFSDPKIVLTLSASAQAPDGMEVRARYEFDARTEAELPGEEEILRQAKAVAARADALSRAPVTADEYVGPVLFAGRAAGSFFLSAVGDPLSSPRDDLGASRPGRLVDRLGKHIAVAQLSVRDDPTQKAWRGFPLFGYFPVDDDSVAPQPITLVEQGVLETYFMSRVPTAKVQASNGHAREGSGSVGNLFVETSEPVSRAELKKRLLALAQQEDLEYGLRVEELDDASNGRFLSESPGTVQLPSPLVAWRVYPDGHEELERGARFKTATYRVLKEIAAMGDDPSAANFSQRGQDVSVVAPSVLVRVMELQRQRDEFEKPPALARPSL